MVQDQIRKAYTEIDHNKILYYVQNIMDYIGNLIYKKNKMI
jgi:hypothetical protein